MTWAGWIAGVDRLVVDTFHDDAIYTPAVGDPVPVRCVFDRSYLLAADVGGPGVSTTAPAAFLRVADLPGNPPPYGDLHVRGVDYRVTEPKPDGQGGVLLVLAEV